MGLTVAVKRNKNLGVEIDKFVLLVVKKLTVKFLISTMCHCKCHNLKLVCTLSCDNFGKTEKHSIST